MELADLQASTVWVADGYVEKFAITRAALQDKAADLLGFLLRFAQWQGIDLSAAFVTKWGPFDPAGKP